jgi:Flp pilus assembly protein CpaB
VVAIATAAVVASDLAALHRRAADIGPVVDAVVASRGLPMGTTLGADDLDVRRVHRSQLPPGALEHRGLAVGRVVAVPVVRGGFVAQANLAPRRRRGIDGVVPRGMRAMRVVASNALRPRAGAAVDVLATFDRDEPDGDSATVVVAAGATVIATDATSGSAETGDTLGVTLLVDADDARRLAFAQANGVVTIALVPPEDATRR